MKTKVIFILLTLAVSLTAYANAPMVIGWSPVCKYNPSFNTAQCQYNSYDQCLSSLNYGETCIQRNQLQ